MDDDTVVIFFSDNGRLTPRGIHWPFDQGLRVPVIARDAKNFRLFSGKEKPGTVSKRVVSLLDLTATTLALAGIERPFGMQSRVFLGKMADPARSYAFAARDRIDETVVRMRSVHDNRYHYIRNHTPGAGFETLNRYKEKCFLVKPLMRKLKTEGKLSGPPRPYEAISRRNAFRYPLRPSRNQKSSCLKQTCSQGRPSAVTQRS